MINEKKMERMIAKSRRKGEKNKDNDESLSDVFGKYINPYGYTQEHVPMLFSDESCFGELLKLQNEIAQANHDKLHSESYDDYLSNAIKQYQLVLDYADLVEEKTKETIDILKIQEKIYRKNRRMLAGEERRMLEYDLSLIKPKIKVLKVTLPKMIYLDRKLFKMIQNNFVPQLQECVEIEKKTKPFDKEALEYLIAYELYYMQADDPEE